MMLVFTAMCPPGSLEAPHQQYPAGPAAKVIFRKLLSSTVLLTKKCNGCHADNDINKEVPDRSLEGMH